MQVNHQWFVSFAVAMSVFASCRNCAFGRPRILFHLLYSSLREHLRFQLVCINLANGRFGSLVALARHDGSEREVGLALLEVRRMLEVGSAGLAAARITDDRLQAMESAIAELRRADADDDVDAAAAADLDFHNHIIKAASNPFVSVTFAPLRDELVVARRITSSCHKVRAHAVTQHEHILTALRLGSPDAAQAAMRAHMDQTTNDLLEYIT